jgi:hypothetical protein
VEQSLQCDVMQFIIFEKEVADGGLVSVLEFAVHQRLREDRFAAPWVGRDPQEIVATG